MVSVVTPGYLLTSEDLKLGSTKTEEEKRDLSF